MLQITTNELRCQGQRKTLERPESIQAVKGNLGYCSMTCGFREGIKYNSFLKKIPILVLHLLFLDIIE